MKTVFHPHPRRFFRAFAGKLNLSSGWFYSPALLSLSLSLWWPQWHTVLRNSSLKDVRYKQSSISIHVSLKRTRSSWREMWNFVHRLEVETLLFPSQKQILWLRALLNVKMVCRDFLLLGLLFTLEKWNLRGFFAPFSRSLLIFQF